MPYNVDEVNNFLKTNGINTTKPELVKIAFTHPSYTNENSLDYTQNYERLEFLGDAVLKLVASKYLFSKYPSDHEGELTKIRAVLVSDLCLDKFARKVGLEKFLRLGNIDFNKTKGLPASIVACSFEALLGALYLSLEFSNIEKFLIKFFDEIIDDIKNNVLCFNAKAALQEYTQAQNKQLPVYKLQKTFGPEHDKNFEVAVYFNDEFLAVGLGKTKKEAQQNAACEACKKLGVIDNDKQ